MIALLYTDGQLNISDLKFECVPQQWVPLLILRYRTDDQIVLPVFELTDVARAFAKRNLPKNWKHGAVHLTDCDMAIIEKKGWVLQKFYFPRKLCDSTDFVFDLEIHDFDHMPSFRCD